MKIVSFLFVFMVTVAASEVIADIYIKVAESVVCAKLAFMVVISVQDGTCTSIPTHVVVYNAKTTDTVNVEVLELKDVTHIVVVLTFCFLITDSCRKRGSEQPVICKDIIVCVTTTKRKVGIVYLIEIETVVKLNFVVCVLVDYFTKAVVI